MRFDWVLASNFRTKKGELAHFLVQDLRKAAILVYANKQDLKDAMKASEISNLLDLTSIKTHNWQIQSCSALNGTGIQEGLEWMVDQLMTKKTAGTA